MDGVFPAREDKDNQQDEQHVDQRRDVNNGGWSIPVLVFAFHFLPPKSHTYAMRAYGTYIV
ncbi:MAG TPA: hypothetical protein VFY40_19660 [Blastocatellia bacterium]|nr:hypothetical protein [Blastocatellia bacterium]